VQARGRDCPLQTRARGPPVKAWGWRWARGPPVQARGRGPPIQTRGRDSTVQAWGWGWGPPLPLAVVPEGKEGIRQAGGDGGAGEQGGGGGLGCCMRPAWLLLYRATGSQMHAERRNDKSWRLARGFSSLEGFRCAGAAQARPHSVDTTAWLSLRAELFTVSFPVCSLRPHTVLPTSFRFLSEDWGSV